ncbi:hypothetical protein [Nonlabens marinus]|uniref:C1q domain-containing protein n=1 Tax=Nonlabens marinus S1-08 TaxID=1454201 RepID=W8W040_9FLAO|nr:hypothetical protein [Nonlabens marinus]BAO55661.1 hypothetical protein NMS_1652 [Nonlabens marinus S1-08]
MNKLLLFSFTLLGVISTAQVGIGTNLPADGTLLHIEDGSGNKGILIPKVEITDLSTIAPLPAAASEGTLVFNEISSTGIEIGFYYWSGNTTGWLRLSDSESDESIYKGDGTIGELRQINVDENSLQINSTATANVDGRDAFIIRRTNNDDELGIAFRNSGNFFDAAIGIASTTNSQLKFYTVGNEANAEDIGSTLSLDDAGTIIFDLYGQGNKLGTPSYNLLVNNAGEVVEKEYLEPFTAKFAVNDQYTAGGANQRNVNENFVSGSNELPLFGNVLWNDNAAVAAPATGAADENDLIINEDGLYRFTVNLSFQSTTARTNVDVFIELTRAGADSFPGAKHSNNYVRQLDGHNNSSVSFTEVLELQTGDDISIIGAREANAGDVFFRSATENPGVVSSIFVERIR